MVERLYLYPVHYLSSLGLHSCAGGKRGTWSPLVLFYLLVEHVLLLVLSQVLSGSLEVHEHEVHPSDINHLHFLGLSLGGDQGTCCDQLDGVTQRCVLADLGKELLGVFSHVHVFLLASCVDDLPDLLSGVGFSVDD